MKHILQLILDVNIDDSRALDDIDAGVALYMGACHPQLKFSPAFMLFMYGAKYTRSKNDLKLIRPKGWAFLNDYAFPLEGKCYRCEANKSMVDDGVFSPFLPSEELAELYCIIQAICHEIETESSSK